MEAILSQRRDQDCAVAAMGWYFHLRYEDVFVAAIQVAPGMLKAGGLSIAEMQGIARRLGRRFRRVHWRHVDLEDHQGVLTVNWNHPKKQHGSHGHCVVLRKGTIICPCLPSAWDADEYLAVEDGRVGTLLVDA